MDLLQANYASDEEEAGEEEAPKELTASEVAAKRREIAQRFALRSRRHFLRHQTLHNKSNGGNPEPPCTRKGAANAANDSWPVRINKNQCTKGASLDHDRSTHSRRPTGVLWSWQGHSKKVNCVQWNLCHGTKQLFLSASMDQTIRLWSCRSLENTSTSASADETANASKDGGPIQRNCLRVHGDSAVADAKWSLDGCQVLSGGYDKRVVCSDVESNATLQALTTSDFVSRLQVHPSNAQLVLFGTFSRGIYCWDMRQNTIVREYKRQFGQVQDLCFLPTLEADDPESSLAFVSSSCVQRQSASNQTLLVWDFATGALLADQLDREMYGFPSVRVHPSRRFFLAQSSGGYACSFDCASYKLVKKNPKIPRGTKRLRRGLVLQSHQMDGLVLRGSFNCSGTLFGSGDASGQVVVYDGLAPSRSLGHLQVFSSHEASTSTEFHPSLESTLVTCSSAGQLALVV